MKIIVTAGATIEPIDPVRYITNRSTGVMGYEIAREALRRKAEVFLVSGPAEAKAPAGAGAFRVETALQMKEQVEKLLPGADCLIMAAAVSDFRAKKRALKKIKKDRGFALELVRTPDILQSLKAENGLIKVGFALETENAERNARKKLKEKGLDFIVVNSVAPGKTPFGRIPRHDYAIVDKYDSREDLPGKTKKQIAKVILDKVCGVYHDTKRKNR